MYQNKHFHVVVFSSVVETYCTYQSLNSAILVLAACSILTDHRPHVDEILKDSIAKSLNVINKRIQSEWQVNNVKGRSSRLTFDRYKVQWFIFPTSFYINEAIDQVRSRESLQKKRKTNFYQRALIQYQNSLHFCM